MAFGFGVGIQRIGSVGVATRDELFAIAPAAGIRPTGFVFGDSTAAYNGVYDFNGTAWTKRRGLPDSLAVLTGIGGTANAITGSLPAFVDPAAVALVILVPTASNTGAVTLNGTPVLDASGAALAAGALTAGRSFLLQVASGSYRVLLNSLGLISDISGLQAALDAKANASAVAAALETKADATETATALAGKADAAATTAALSARYTKTEADALLGGKASATTAIRDDIDQSAQSKTAAQKVNILKNSLQAWELVPGGFVSLITGAPSVTWDNLSAYIALRFTGLFAPSVTDATLSLRMGAGGVTATTNEYGWQVLDGLNSTVASGTVQATALSLTYPTASSVPANHAVVSAVVHSFNRPRPAIILDTAGSANNAGGQSVSQRKGWQNTAVARDTLSLLVSSGLIAPGSYFVLEGLRG